MSPVSPSLPSRNAAEFALPEPAPTLSTVTTGGPSPVTALAMHGLTSASTFWLYRCSSPLYANTLPKSTLSTSTSAAPNIPSSTRFPLILTLETPAAAVWRPMAYLRKEE